MPQALTVLSTLKTLMRSKERTPFSESAFLHIHSCDTDIHIQHCKAGHILNGSADLFLHLLADGRDIKTVADIQGEIYGYVILGHIYLNALAQVFHAQLSHQLIGDIARHGIHAVYLRGCKACDNGHYLVCNLNLADPVFFV